MASTDKIYERKTVIMEKIARKGPLLLKDLYPLVDVKRQTVSGYLKDLVNAGCLRTIPVDEDMREENDLREGAGPLYTVNEDKLDECNFISDVEAQKIREDINRVRRHMIDNGLVENPTTEEIKDFLEEFLPGGKFEDSDEIEIKKSEISSGGLSLREFQEFIDLWQRVMASDPNHDIDMAINTSPKNGKNDHPDVLLLETLQDLKDVLK